MCWGGASLQIGNNSGMSNTSIICTNSISIGDNVKIGAGCLLMDSNFHSLDYETRRNSSLDGKNAVSSPIIIEDDVFIGTRCLILKGVTIGARSIIAGGSVVVHSIPSDCIAGGNPCVIIKMNINRE